MKNCTHPGCENYRLLVKDQFRYCAQCSSSLKEILPKKPAETNKKYCGCGWCNPDENKYCDGCGEEFKSTPKKECVKTAILDILSKLHKQFYDKEKRFEKSGRSLAFYMVQDARQAVEMEMVRIKELEGK